MTHPNDNLGPNVISLNARRAAKGLGEAPADKAVKLTEAEMREATLKSLERDRKRAELRFYDDLQAIIEKIGELGDMAEFGAGEAAVDEAAREIIDRIDRLPPPHENKERLDLGRVGLAQPGIVANDKE